MTKHITSGSSRGSGSRCAFHLDKFWQSYTLSIRHADAFLDNGEPAFAYVYLMPNHCKAENHEHMTII